MTDSINTNNRLRNNGITPDAKAAAGAKSAKTGGNQTAAGSTAANASTVELSNASLMEALSEQIKSLPVVNEVKVDAVKQALVNGEYQPDAEVIARKYSEIEKLLP